MMAQDYAALLGGFAQQIDQKQYIAKSEGAPLSLLQHSFSHMMQTQEEQGVKSMFLGAILDKVKERIAQGGGDDEFSGLVETLSMSK